MKKPKADSTSKARSKRKKVESSEVEMNEPLETQIEPSTTNPTSLDAVVVDSPGATQPAQQLGRNQKIWIDTMLVFADCCVQRNPEGIFDVLARNFEDTGGLNWWLWRIGYGEITKIIKGKDVVDSFRICSNMLFKRISMEVDRPVSRF